MPPFWHPRLPWLALLAAIIATGILSRVFPVGHPLFDKYLGDALYAAMVYVLLHLTERIRHVALWTTVVMTALECFQLTGIPAALLRNELLPVRLIARLLGTHFHWLDLAAYAAGILPFTLLHRPRREWERSPGAHRWQFPP